MTCIVCQVKLKKESKLPFCTECITIYKSTDPFRREMIKTLFGVTIETVALEIRSLRAKNRCAKNRQKFNQIKTKKQTLLAEDFHGNPLKVVPLDRGQKGIMLKCCQPLCKRKVRLSRNYFVTKGVKKVTCQRCM